MDLFGAPESQERALLEKSFRFHRLAVQDATRIRHPPKIERFDDYSFLIFMGLDADTAETDFGTIQIALFVGERFLINRHSGESPGTDWLWERVVEVEGLFENEPASLSLMLVDRIIRRYLPILLALETRLEVLEEKIFERPEDTLMAELSGYKANLKRMRRIFTYHEQMLKQLKLNPAPYYGREQIHELNDIHEQLERSMSLTGLYNEIASNFLDGYLALASHRLNRVMQDLTIFTVIFVPLSFLAGIYGMNFANIPELKLEYGYILLLGFMFSIVCVQIFLFRKKKWL